MPNPWGSQNVQCPYYITHDARGRANIVCEGAFSRSTRHNFKCRADRDSHMAAYCNDMPGWRECPHCKVVELKYKDPPE